MHMGVGRSHTQESERTNTELSNHGAERGGRLKNFFYFKIILCPLNLTMKSVTLAITLIQSGLNFEP